MPPYVATTFCVIFILGLYWLGRKDKAGTSAALWIPVIWFCLAASRSVSQWLNGTVEDTNDLLLEGDPLDRAVYAALLAAGLIVLVKRAGIVKKLLRANGPVLIFFAYCAVSIVWSEFPGVAVKRWFKTVGDLIMVLVVWSENDPTAAVRRFLAWPAYLLMPLSILLIKYYPALGRYYGRWLGELHAIGVTTNKNTLGAICMLFGLATLWTLFTFYRNQRKLGRARLLATNGALMGIILWLLWMADSMTSSLCFVMGAGLLLWLNRSSISRRPRSPHFIIGVILLVCVAVLFLGASPSVLEAMGKSSTLTDRTEMWPLLLSLSANSFVGTGFESFWLGSRLSSIWSVYAWKPNQAHNGYLEIYLNLGWTGVVLLVAVLVTGYHKVFQSYRRNAPLGSLLLTFFVVGLIYNFTEAAFFQMMSPVWVIVLMAIVGHSVAAQMPKPYEEVAASAEALV